MRNREGRVWEIVLASGGQTADTRGMVPDKEFWSLFLYCHSEGWGPEH